MDDIASTIIKFVRSIGIPVTVGLVPDDTVLPGMIIQNGGLVIDPEQLLYPGDILHEAGHLAVTTPENRPMMGGALDSNSDTAASEEMMAIPWSYAACLHLGMDPKVVFHPNGYHGGGDSIIENFSQGRYFGVPMLQWIGLTVDEKNAKEKGMLPFPEMIKWIRE